MTREKNVFSEEYVSNSEKTSIDVKDTQQDKPSEPEIDSNYYKTSKPRRQIIRGKITNG